MKKKPAAASRAVPESGHAVLPVAREPWQLPRTAPSTTTDILRGEAWFTAMLADTKQAQSFVAASYVFDDEETQKMLLERLRSPRPFECHLIVDAAAHREARSRGQRSCLKALKEAGAKVYFGKGSNDDAARRLFGRKAYGGQMHLKAVVIDSRVAYVGSANCTRQARCNSELMCRLTGPPVTQVLTEVSAAIANATSDP